MPDDRATLTDIAAEIEKKPVLRTGERKTATPDYSDIHAIALERYESGYEKDRKNQDLAYKDLRFKCGDVEGAQWEDNARQLRETEQRPILTINKCPQFVRQVTGDIRQLRPAVKIVPVDDMASKDVAVKILPGMVRYIEQRSDAKGAYFAAADQQTTAGIGHCRVNIEFASGSTMDRELAIGHVEDGISVIWDPDAIHPTRKDADWCFVPIDMRKQKFEERWPNATTAPLTESRELFYTWFTDDHVRVTEYWYKKPIKRKIATYPTGQMVDLTDDEDGSKQADVDAFNARAATLAQMQALTPQPIAPVGQVEIEERDSYQVCRCVISAREILEGPEVWPGMQIPIVPFLGEETKVGREIIRNGIIRSLQDVQRVYNYAMSADAEAVALQPKAPWIGTQKNFEQFEDDWEVANQQNFSHLKYTPDPANGGGPPQRVTPPVASSGIRELLAVATQDFSGVTGIYPSSLGMASNEASGKAIQARQREGDTGTFLYIENFGRGIQRVGEILIDLIPHVYDTQRTIRIVGEDGKIDVMEINKTIVDPNGDGIATVVQNDLTVGSYEVAVEMGPSYSTKREEARDGMATFMQAAGPEVAQLFLDLFAKMQDWPLADKIGRRAQLMLPPHIQQMEAKEAGEPPPPLPPPPGPTPEQQMHMAEMQEKSRLHEANLAIDNRKIDAEFARIEADLQTANRNHEAAMAGHACTLKQMEMNANGMNGKGDNRVDALADAVAQLYSVVNDLANAIGVSGGGPVGPAPPAPGGPPPGSTAPPGVPPVPPGAPPPTMQ